MYLVPLRYRATSLVPSRPGPGLLRSGTDLRRLISAYLLELYGSPVGHMASRTSNYTVELSDRRARYAATFYLYEVCTVQ